MKKLSEMLRENGVPLATGTDADGAEPMDRMERYHKMMAAMHNQREGKLHLEDGYDCPICKNRGSLVQAEKTEFGYWTEMEYYCQCRPVRKAIREMKRSGLYNLLERYTMDTYRVSEPWQANIRDKAQEFVEQTLANQQSEDWFFIGGASGSGKTHICTAICRELLYKGMSVRYMQWRDAAVKLKAVANDFVEYAQRMDSWKNAKVLYVDDLFKSGSAYGSGRQQPTAADINLAFELLNHRYNNPELITILSSECTLHNLLDIDEAIGGRIAERAKGFTVNLAAGRGKNYRTKVTGA